jgi:cell division protein FtsL
MPALSLPQLNPYERKKLFILSALTICIIGLWLLLSPKGTLHLFSVQSELSVITEENKALRAENEALQAEITKLKTDSEYIEQIAREKGLLKHNEMVFVFK